jgi:hypothetical protein
MDHLAALTGLTSLAYGAQGKGTDPIGAISQLTRLRSLRLEPPSKFSNAQLTRLSTVGRLTSLQITGWWPMQLLDCTPISCTCFAIGVWPLMLDALQLLHLQAAGAGMQMAAG